MRLSGQTQRNRLKPLLAALVLIAGSPLYSQQVIVFGAGDTCVVDPQGPLPPLGNLDKASFARDCQSDQARHEPFESTMDLSNPPAPDRTVGETARGRIYFHPSFRRGFVCRVILESLSPKRDYVLCLAGDPEHAGNGLLLSAGPGPGTGRLYDFAVVTTDAEGGFEGSFGVFLKAGGYDVRFCVRDTADPEVVLYHDFFKFAVH